MELRQQVNMPFSEVKQVILEHLKKSGLRISQQSIKIDRDGALFALTMTEEEIHFADTELIVTKPLISLGLQDSKLKKKILCRMPADAKIGDLLKIRLQNNYHWDDFKNKNFLKDELFSNSIGKRDKLKPKEEAILIKTFSDLGIKLKTTLGRE